ncbi:hypothetical protein JCM15093_2765 [Bacteroides graminisolvens DSM 19988 = JCM 15093]|uniref:Uncharacterized protein n=1 Tax=Bacteroides graminisolvens DSM 19988 = JCM 15093 TaxID=1121097 RepID=A0A069D5C6_9BACE|nr:hypothetical protein JCM15093_2765 [Bacteroides graminisolvens DSM 19988 = JCM 15093]
MPNKIRHIATINRVISIVLSISINFVGANIDFCPDYTSFLWIKKRKWFIINPHI